MSVANEILWFLEGHLTGDLSLDRVADATGVSRFHASRAFALATGRAVSEYARARRLSEAAKALAAGAHDIQSIAHEAGYGSHEAFTRAFRSRFGMTPEQLRAQADTSQLTLQEPLTMNHSAQTGRNQLAAPRIVQHDALLIFGLSRTYGADSGATIAGIPSQWDRFLPHVMHIRGQVGETTYGVCCNTDEKGSFDYITGVEVSEFPEQPKDLTRLRIPPQRYAVFAHPGHISTVHASWQAIWDHALRGAGLQAADGPGFERYGKEFDSKTGNGGLEIWIPVAGTLGT